MRLTEPTRSTRAQIREQEKIHAQLRRELRARGIRIRPPRRSAVAERGAVRG